MWECLEIDFTNDIKLLRRTLWKERKLYKTALKYLNKIVLKGNFIKPQCMTLKSY